MSSRLRFRGLSDPPHGTALVPFLTCSCAGCLLLSYMNPKHPRRHRRYSVKHLWDPTLAFLSVSRYVFALLFTVLEVWAQIN